MLTNFSSLLWTKTGREAGVAKWFVLEPEGTPSLTYKVLVTSRAFHSTELD